MIFITSDHAGFDAKEKLKKYLSKKRYEIKDLGPEEYLEQDDYPDYVKMASKEILRNRMNKGIFICGAGHGMCIAANKIKGIYASVCWDKKSARYAREHNNANVLCIAARFLSEKKINEITETWLKTKFSKAARHTRRLNKIKKIERHKK
jgi:ribose 5-phosphate isomerase B